MKFRGCILTAMSLLAAFMIIARNATCDPLTPRAVGTDAAQKEMRFQRIFVPEGDIESWPCDDWRYIPMDSARFERIVNGPPVSPRPSARLLQTEYEGTLEGDVLRGRGQWKIESTGDGGTIDLSSVSLAISDFTNKSNAASEQPSVENLGEAATNDLDDVDDPDEKESDENAITLGSSDAGPFLKINGSTTASFVWSARGTPQADRGIAFNLRFPESSVGRLKLTLLPGYRIEVDAGLEVCELDDAEGSVWRVELGGRRHCRLHVIPPETSRSTTAASRGALSYVASPRGVEFSAEWDVHFMSETSRFIELLVDESLSLTHIAVDRQPCTWVPMPNRDGRRVVRVQIPDVVQVENATLLAKGIVARSAATGPEVLPRVRIPGASWLGETVEVRIDSPLTATRIIPKGSIQTKWTALPAPRRGELFEFLGVDPEWEIELETAFPKPRVSTEEAISLQFGPNEIQTRVKTLFQTTQGRVFEIEADIGPRWIIDSVQADASSAVEDWSVERIRRNGRRKLVVQLARPLTPKRPLELTVSARLLYSTRQRSLTVEQMRPLQYVAAEMNRRVLSLRAIGDVQLRTRGAESLSRIDPDHLNNERFASFLRSSGTLVFLDDKKSDSLHVMPRKQIPRFSTNIELTASMADGVLSETYAIACTPESTRIERFWIRFSESRDEPIHWAFADGKQSQLQAKKLDATRKASIGAALEGETWEILLGAPRSVPFEIRASRRTAVEGDATVSLAWLPESRKSEAFVSVLADAGHAAKIVSTSLEPVVPPPVPSGRYHATSAVFAYDYRDLDSGGLVIHSGTKDDAENPIWAWKARIDSEFASSGREIHAVRYYLENTGAKTVTVSLPAGLARSQVREVQLDGRDVPWEGLKSEEGLQVSVGLPAGKRHLDLRIAFTRSGSALGLYRRVETPRINSDFEVLETDWITRFAPGYRPIASLGAYSGIVHRLASLVGPFAARWTTMEPEPLCHGMDGMKMDAKDFVADGLARKAGGNPAVDQLEETHKESLLAGFRSLESPSGRNGWVAFRFQPIQDQDNAVLVVRRPLMRSLGYAVLLTVVGLGIGVFRAGRAFCFCGAAACVVACLLVSPVFLTLVSGGFLGFVAVALSRLFRKSDGGSDFESGAAQFVPQKSNGPVGAVVVLGVVAILATSTLADVPSVGSTAGALQETPVFPVLVPLAEDSDAEATRVLVPEPLYRELHHRVALPDTAPIAVISALYDCELAWSVDEEELVPHEWRMRYEVVNRAQSSVLTLPIKSTEGVVRSDGVRVDGRLTAWRTASGSMRIPVNEPGRHRIEVLVRPKVITSNGKHVANVGIPPVLSAEATVTVPVNGPVVSVTSARGAIQRDRRTGKTHAMLGPATSLSVAWRRPESHGGSEFADAEAKCLLWLHLRPESVHLDSRFFIQGLPKTVKSIDLRSNTNLRLVDPDTEGGVHWTSRSEQSEADSIFRVTSENGFSRSVPLNVHFLLKDRRGTQRIALPRVVPVGIPATRVWLAISVDPRLQLPKNGSTQSISPKEFITVWGETETPPDMVYSLDDRSARFVEAILKDDTLEVDQEAVYEIDAESMLIEFRANIDTQSPRFSHQVQIPDEVQIESVSVQQEAVRRSVRWSRDSCGAVNVFLGEPVSGKHTLLLRGRMPIPVSGELNVPVPALVDAELKESLLLLARRFGATVRILDEVGCMPMEISKEREETLSDSRFVQGYRADGKSPELRVAVEANNPVIDASQISAPYLDDGTWRVCVDVRLVPRHGSVDQITLGLSENVGNVVRITPREPLALHENADGGRLVIRPKQPIRESWYGRLIFDLKKGAGMGRVLPRVDLLPVDAGELRVVSRKMILPTRHLGRELNWERRHLRPAGIPSNYVWPGAGSDTSKAFEIVSDDYNAVLVLRDAPKGVATVRFADIFISQTASRMYGVALYDVEPAGHSECPLELPFGCRLVRAFVSDIPVRPVPRPLPKSLSGEKRFSLPLASRVRPQRITVVFETKKSKKVAKSAASVGYPRLAYLPVQGGIATMAVEPDASLELAETTQLSAEQADLLRLQGLTTVIRRTTATIGIPTESDLRWFAVWSRRVVSLADRLDSSSPAAKILMEEIHEIARRWKKEDLWNDVCIQSRGLAEMQDVWESFVELEADLPQRLTRVFIPKNTDYMAEPATFDESTDSPSLRYLMAAFLSVTIVYLAFGLRGRHFTKWFFYPHFAGVLLGILWFAFLRPEVAGPVAMGFFVLASLRPAWRWVRV